MSKITCIDPYTSDQFCITRLLSEYRTHGRLIIAVDFDDTVFDFHGVGHRYDYVLSLLRRCQDLSFYLVLFTGTDPDNWEIQRLYLEDKGISIEKHINQNPMPLPFGNHGKMYYNILLDDRAGLGQACTVLSAVLDTIEKESK